MTNPRRWWIAAIAIGLVVVIAIVCVVEGGSLVSLMAFRTFSCGITLRITGPSLRVTWISEGISLPVAGLKSGSKREGIEAAVGGDKQPVLRRDQRLKMA
jgi:hypothetical protein